MYSVDGAPLAGGVQYVASIFKKFSRDMLSWLSTPCRRYPDERHFAVSLSSYRLEALNVSNIRECIYVISSGELVDFKARLRRCSASLAPVVVQIINPYNPHMPPIVLLPCAV